MFAKIGGMTSRTNHSLTSSLELPHGTRLGNLFADRPVTRADDAKQARSNISWPPGLMLILAGAVSLLLWAGIIESIRWVHHAWGWF